MFRLQSASLKMGAGGRTVVDAVCGLPFDAPSIDSRELGAHLNKALKSSQHFTRPLTESDIGEKDLATLALVAEDVARAVSSGLGSSVRSSRMLFQSAGLQQGGGGDPQNLAAWVITASPNGNWFFNTRVLHGIWSALLKWSGDLQVEHVSYDGGQHPCEILSETWLILEDLRRDIEDALALLAANGGTNQDFDATVLCPDSLMSVGQTCLDFYIATATAFLFDGNNRDTDPYAGIEQSKVFLIADFDNNRLLLEISGTVMFGTSLHWKGGHPAPITFGATYFPSNEHLQINRLTVDSLGDNQRVVTMQIGNAACAAGEAYLTEAFGTYDKIPKSLLDAFCLDIDAKIWYERDRNGWVPSLVERDAFPNLDIHRKRADGSLETINQSTARTRTLGFMFLSGLLKLKYDVEDRQQELQDDLSNSYCALQ